MPIVCYAALYFPSLSHTGSLILILTSSLGDLAIEAFTCLLIFKNFFSFGLTFRAYKWIVEFGIFNTFMVVSSIQVVVCLLSIPMCKSCMTNAVYQQRSRS